MVQIRDELPSDADAIDAVTVAAFRHAAHASHTEQFIVRALRNSEQLVVALVAEEGGIVIGHVAVSPVTIAGISSGWYGLGPISVLPAHQGRGVGTLLVQGALARLRALGASGCVVLGEPGITNVLASLPRRSCSPECRRDIFRPSPSTATSRLAQSSTMPRSKLRPDSSSRRTREKARRQIRRQALE